MTSQQPHAVYQDESDHQAKPFKHESMHDMGRGLAWLPLAIVALVIFVFGVCEIYDWFVHHLNTAKAGTVVMWICIVMGMTCIWFGVCRTWERKSARLWWFGTAFFVTGALQSFLTRGGGS